MKHRRLHPEPVRVAFDPRIEACRVARKRLGLSQDCAASYLGVCRQTVTHIETGLRRASEALVCRYEAWIDAERGISSLLRGNDQSPRALATGDLPPPGGRAETAAASGAGLGGEK